VEECARLCKAGALPVPGRNTIAARLRGRGISSLKNGEVITATVGARPSPRATKPLELVQMDHNPPSTTVVLWSRTRERNGDGGKTQRTIFGAAPAYPKIRARRHWTWPMDRVSHRRRRAVPPQWAVHHARSSPNALPLDLRRQRRRQVLAPRKIQARSCAKARPPKRATANHFYANASGAGSTKLYGEIVRTLGGNVRTTARFYELEHATISLLTHANPRILIIDEIQMDEIHLLSCSARDPI
jgi:hypothetical protein